MLLHSPTHHSAQPNEPIVNLGSASGFSDVQLPPTGTLTNHSNPASGSGSQQNIEISSASVKLPQFWTSCPEAWFVHSEMQFATKGIIRDNTKYEYTITALPQEVIITVLDVIQSPPSGNKYENLKGILIERHTISENRKLDKILSDTEIGDRKPSEFYRSLALLAGSNFSIDVLKKLWLRKLPKSLNVALTGSNLTEVSQLMKLADNLWDVIQGDEIASIRESSVTQSANSCDLGNIVTGLVQATSNMCENFRTLSLEVSSIKRHLEDYQRRPLNGRFGRSRSRSRGNPNRNTWLCKYHYRYRSKARKCEQPCSYLEQHDDSTN